MPMSKEITTILEYLLTNHNGDYPDKYLKIDINNENNDNVRIDATGPWIKDFNAKLFISEFWVKSKKKICIHIGKNTDCLKHFETYKYCHERQQYLLQLEEQYIDNCEYYISLVLNIAKNTLKSKFPVIKKYIRAVAEKNKDIKIQIIAHDEFWKEDAKIDKCINLICDGLTTVMLHDSTNACTDLMKHHFGVSTKESVTEKLKIILANKILNYNDDDLKV